MTRSPNLLFSDKQFSEYRREQLEQMKDEISTLSSEELNQNSTDSLALIFSSKYSPPLIQLHDTIKEDGGQVEKKIENGMGIPTPGRGKPTRKYQRLKVRLQFDGKKDIFRYRSSTYNYNPPIYNELNTGEVVYYVDYLTQNREPEEVKEKIQREINNWEEDVEWWVEQINDDIQSMQKQFENEARSAIQRRQEEVETKTQVMEKLGVDTGAPEDRGYIIPEKKRNIELPAPSKDDSTEVLPDQIYIEILGIIDDLGVNIERSAERVRSLDEESLRDLFLAGINSHFAGLATGESFNRSGKTDIFLPHDNETLFISECKFWQGQSKYKEAIDQLLDNLTVRDSHASLIIFSRRTNFTQVQDRVEEATKDHSGYETKLSDFGDHEVYRFQIDSGIPVKVAVKIFDLH